MDLESADVLTLQTKHMRDDPAVRGYSAALTEQIRRLAGETRFAAIYSRIDTLPAEVLDILAWQFNAAWYDSGATVEEKRDVIKQVIDIHRIRGTPASVQRVVEIYFGDGDVEEWWEFDGSPGTFRVVTTNPLATAEKAELLIRSVNAVKRLSSHLDSVVIITTDEMPVYYGFALQTGDYVTIEQVV